MKRKPDLCIGDMFYVGECAVWDATPKWSRPGPFQDEIHVGIVVVMELEMDYMGDWMIRVLCQGGIWWIYALDMDDQSLLGRVTDEP